MKLIGILEKKNNVKFLFTRGQTAQTPLYLLKDVLHLRLVQCGRTFGLSGRVCLLLK